MAGDPLELGAKVTVRNVRNALTYLGRDGVGNAICETIVPANKKPERRALPMADVQLALPRFAKVAGFSQIDWRFKRRNVLSRLCGV